jgi:hypothetical protein
MQAIDETIMQNSVGDRALQSNHKCIESKNVAKAVYYERKTAR